jgi:hypothetical protein
MMAVRLSGLMFIFANRLWISMPDKPASIKNELLQHETKILFPLLPLARGQMLKVLLFIE